MRIILDIQNNERAKTLAEVLSQLSFVKTEKGREERITKKKIKALDDIFGIWKDRNISKGEYYQFVKIGMISRSIIIYRAG